MVHTWPPVYSLLYKSSWRLCLFHVVFVMCAWSMWFFHGVHGNSISCHNFTCLFLFLLFLKVTFDVNSHCWGKRSNIKFQICYLILQCATLKWNCLLKGSSLLAFGLATIGLALVLPNFFSLEFVSNIYALRLALMGLTFFPWL